MINCKKAMLGVAMSLCASGAVNAGPLIGGAGSIAMGGVIDVDTCIVGFDKPSVNVPVLGLPTIGAIANNGTLYTDHLQLEIKNCGAMGNMIEISAMRDAEPPSNVSSPNLAGGLTFSGSAATDSTTAPIYYRMIKLHSGGSGTLISSLDGNITTGNSIDTGGASTYPMRISVHKSPAQVVDASQYVGTYSGNFTYSVTYP